MPRRHPTLRPGDKVSQGPEVRRLLGATTRPTVGYDTIYLRARKS